MKSTYKLRIIYISRDTKKQNIFQRNWHLDVCLHFCFNIITFTLKLKEPSERLFFKILMTKVRKVIPEELSDLLKSIHLLSDKIELKLRSSGPINS